jgi:hypothetical protein
MSARIVSSPLPEATTIYVIAKQPDRAKIIAASI